MIVRYLSDRYPLEKLLTIIILFKTHLTLTPGSCFGPIIVYVFPDPVWP